MITLKDRLHSLSERGTPVGSSQLRDRVLLDLAGRGAFDPGAESAPDRRSPFRRPAVVVATAAVLTLFAIGLVAIVPLLSGESPDLAERPSVTVTLTVTATAVPSTTLPESVAAESFTLVPATDVEPVQVSAVLGDLEFVTMQITSGEFVFFREVAASPHGLVAVDGETLWWTSDYETWQQLPGDLDAMRVAAVGDDVIVNGENSFTRLTWADDRWVLVEQVGFPGAIRGRVAVGPQGVVAVAADGDAIYVSSDGGDFAVAERPPRTDALLAVPSVPPEDADFGDCRAALGGLRSQILNVLATDAGFVAFTSAWHPHGELCSPFLWSSADGNEWNLVSSESPFGALSVVYMDEWRTVAEHDGRFVAFGEIGGQGDVDPRGAVWVSDDALTWRRADVELSAAYAVAGGEMGWMLIGSADEEGFHMWFSEEGLSWDGPHALPDGILGGYFHPQIVVGPGALVAVGAQEQVVVIGRVHDASGFGSEQGS